MLYCLHLADSLPASSKWIERILRHRPGRLDAQKHSQAHPDQEPAACLLMECLLLLQGGLAMATPRRGWLGGLCGSPTPWGWLKLPPGAAGRPRRELQRSFLPLQKTLLREKVGSLASASDCGLQGSFHPHPSRQDGMVWVYSGSTPWGWLKLPLGAAGRPRRKLQRSFLQLLRTRRPEKVGIHATLCMCVHV